MVIITFSLDTSCSPFRVVFQAQTACLFSTRKFTCSHCVRFQGPGVSPQIALKFWINHLAYRKKNFNFS